MPSPSATISNSFTVPKSRICGVLECNKLILLTNSLVWFSLCYSMARLFTICHFLLQHAEDEIEDIGDNDTNHLPIRRPRKHCLWEMAGMILIAYETILSFVLCIGTGSSVFEMNGFFVLIWCLNYPVFLIFHWVFGLFLTKCCIPHKRMKRSSLHNCVVVILNLFWRGLLYWCALNLMFHPKIRTNNDLDLEIVKTINEGVRLAANITMIASGGQNAINIGNHSILTTASVIA